ncbi:MAG: hypothetical protein U0172_02045 [Nitrospiraceae bacterium]
MNRPIVVALLCVIAVSAACTSRPSATTTPSASQQRAHAAIPVPASSPERVALFFSGPACASQLETVRQRLLAVPGVRAAHPNIIPDHLLVDTNGMIAHDQLVEAAAAALANTATCRASIMESCISAGPMDAHATH